jgi:hypothetical protein
VGPALQRAALSRGPSSLSGAGRLNRSSLAAARFPRGPYGPNEGTAMPDRDQVLVELDELGLGDLLYSVNPGCAGENARLSARQVMGKATT